MERATAEGMDRRDPLADLRQRFPPAPSGSIYLDGNSLGRPPAAVLEAIAAASAEWQAQLVGGWEAWIDLPGTVGDRLGALIGAGAGQILVCDSTTVNLYKLAAAALGLSPDRDEVVVVEGDFPTDRYVLQGLAARTGARLVAVANDEDAIESALSARTALVCASHVHFITGRRLDGERVTAAAHRAGALVLWDLAHSAGAVPVALDGWGADLAVGCTYKYLNAGPGAPGFLYVAERWQETLRQPVWGWFGQDRQFEMGEEYRPARGVRSFLTGTPGIIALRAVEAAVALTAEAGIDRLWAKSEGLTDLLVEQVRLRLEPLGARLVTTWPPERRGAHVAVAHPDARKWCQLLIEGDLVVGDFRPPDVLRLGPAPLYTGYAECWEAVERLAAILSAGFAGYDRPPRRVT